MLTFRLDFNEYYTDKFYQASEFDFHLPSVQEDNKGVSVSMSHEEEPPIEKKKK